MGQLACFGKECDRGVAAAAAVMAAACRDINEHTARRLMLFFVFFYHRFFLFSVAKRDCELGGCARQRHHRGFKAFPPLPHPSPISLQAQSWNWTRSTEELLRGGGCWHVETSRPCKAYLLYKDDICKCILKRLFPEYICIFIYIHNFCRNIFFFH